MQLLESARSIASSSPSSLSSSRLRAHHLLDLLNTRLDDFLLSSDPDASTSRLMDGPVRAVGMDAGDDLDTACGTRQVPCCPRFPTPFLFMISSLVLKLLLSDTLLPNCLYSPR